MKAIIHGFRYDTDRAREVGHASRGEGYTDFNFWVAALFVTPKAKRFFLAGEGGPMTIFATRNGNNSGYGERIIPLSRDEALEWAEQHLTADEIESAFGDAIRDA